MGIQDQGAGFNYEKFHLARATAVELTYELATLIRPGMQEADAHQIFQKLLAPRDISKQWHPPKIRFGPNTVKAFREPSDHYILQDEDIYFIDIGPVIDGHEADYGETFVLGDIYQHKLISEASRTIFTEVAARWRAQGANGPELYRFAQERARARSLSLNFSNSGHRIGDFPHLVHFKGKLPECTDQLVADAWILEIHLINGDGKFGAFFEDVLTF
jgi:Xaa-Pro aminopeptidase